MSASEIFFSVVICLCLAVNIAVYEISRRIGPEIEAKKMLNRIIWLLALLVFSIIIKINPPMTIQEAKAIIAKLINYGIYEFGFIPADQLQPIKELSLADMLEANRLVEEAGAEKVPGGRIVHMTIDDRLIAAIYLSQHYEPKENNRSVRPLLSLPDAAIYYIKTEKAEHEKSNKRTGKAHA